MTKDQRRKSSDIWIYFARALAIGGWVFFIIAFIISYFAAPEKSYGMFRYHGIEVRDYWLTPLTGYLYIILWFSAFSSYLCLVIDKYRSRRRSDSRSYNLLLLLLITLVWILYIVMSLLDK